MWTVALAALWTNSRRAGHLEAPQVAVVDGQPLLLFCGNLGPGAAADQVRVVPGPAVTGPWDLSLARPVSWSGRYAPRLVRDAGNRWNLIGFVSERDGAFAGEPSDPFAVRYSASEGLHLI
ncbi:hypothetical protein ILP97_15595 [Amycolatopsis sp. H6(2020)]|nr:hypothetical protein [Amycolatopsis sp. H6(2020)]